MNKEMLEVFTLGLVLGLAKLLTQPTKTWRELWGTIVVSGGLGIVGAALASLIEAPRQVQLGTACLLAILGPTQIMTIVRWIVLRRNGQ